MNAGILATDKVFYLIMLGLIVVVGATVPLGMVLDEHEFRGDAMYADVRTMEWLQFQSIDTRGEGVTGSVASGETIEVAGQEFTPSAGVTVEVEVIDDRYCVRGHNEHGDVSRWHCVDPADPPRAPGDLSDLEGP